MRTLLPLLLLAITGCSAPIEALYPPRDRQSAKAVYVVRHGWHSRIAVERADVRREVWPEVDDLGDVRYVEVGWGDAAFYQADNGTTAQAINASLRTTPAALHVGGFDPPPHEFLPGTDVLRVELSPEGFERLTAFIHAAYAHDEQGKPIATRPGHYPHSSFYRATGRYNALVNNSNTWVARALRAAGAPITPCYAMLSATLMYQVRRIGRAMPGGARAGVTGVAGATRHACA